MERKTRKSPLWVCLQYILFIVVIPSILFGLYKIIRYLLTKYGIYADIALAGLIVILILIPLILWVFKKSKKEKDSTGTTTTAKVVVKRSAPWYAQFLTVAIGLAFLGLAGIFAMAIYHQAKTEKNYGLGSLPAKTPEMVAKTYSYDPYPQYKTIYAGTTRHFTVGETCKYQGTIWGLTTNARPDQVHQVKIGDGSWVIMYTDVDCDIVLSETKPNL